MIERKLLVIRPSISALRFERDFRQSNYLKTMIEQNSSTFHTHLQHLGGVERNDYFLAQKEKNMREYSMIGTRTATATRRTRPRSAAPKSAMGLRGRSECF
ncbi:MAG: hypothetical protein P4L67_02360 [Candidatus Pacebacteria bacterium]|nr:hypothetical protein [Candidatus Paceibacterota bacterium]